MSSSCSSCAGPTMLSSKGCRSVLFTVFQAEGIVHLEKKHRVKSPKFQVVLGSKSAITPSIDAESVHRTISLPYDNETKLELLALSKSGNELGRHVFHLGSIKSTNSYFEGTVNLVKEDRVIGVVDMRLDFSKKVVKKVVDRPSVFGVCVGKHTADYKTDVLRKPGPFAACLRNPSSDSSTIGSISSGARAANARHHANAGPTPEGFRVNVSSSSSTSGRSHSVSSADVLPQQQVHVPKISTSSSSCSVGAKFQPKRPTSSSSSSSSKVKGHNASAAGAGLGVGAAAPVVLAPTRKRSDSSSSDSKKVRRPRRSSSCSSKVKKTKVRRSSSCSSKKVKKVARARRLAPSWSSSSSSNCDAPRILTTPAKKGVRITAHRVSKIDKINTDKGADVYAYVEDRKTKLQGKAVTVKNVDTVLFGKEGHQFDIPYTGQRDIRVSFYDDESFKIDSRLGHAYVDLSLIGASNAPHKYTIPVIVNGVATGELECTACFLDVDTKKSFKILGAVAATKKARSSSSCSSNSKKVKKTKVRRSSSCSSKKVKKAKVARARRLAPSWSSSSSSNCDAPRILTTPAKKGVRITAHRVSKIDKINTDKGADVYAYVEDRKTKLQGKAVTVKNVDTVLFGKEGHQFDIPYTGQRDIRVSFYDDESFKVDNRLGHAYVDLSLIGASNAPHKYTIPVIVNGVATGELECTACFLDVDTKKSFKILGAAAASTKAVKKVRRGSSCSSRSSKKEKKNKKEKKDKKDKKGKKKEKDADIVGVPFLPQSDLTVKLFVEKASIKQYTLGKADPYLVVDYAGQKVKGDVIENGGKAPKFEHAFFLTYKGKRYVEVTIYDDDIGKDKKMGTFTIDLEEKLKEHGIANSPFAMSIVDGKTTVGDISGQIEIVESKTAKAHHFYLKSGESKFSKASKSGSRTLLGTSPKAGSKTAKEVSPKVTKSGPKRSLSSTSHTDLLEIKVAGSVAKPLAKDDYTVRVFIKNGTSLKDQMIGKADPYLFVEYDKAKVRGETIENGGKEPKFDHEFMLPFNGTRYVQVTIYDDDLGKDRKMGYFTIDLEGKIKAGFKTSTFAAPVKNGNKQIGEIHGQLEIVEKKTDNAHCFYLKKIEA